MRYYNFPGFADNDASFIEQHDDFLRSHGSLYLGEGLVLENAREIDYGEWQ